LKLEERGRYETMAEEEVNREVMESSERPYISGLGEKELILFKH
jgi:hypothetical protein